MSDSGGTSERFTIGVPKETIAGERRVSLIPETVRALSKAGVSVLVETGAGAAASHSDAAYQEAGAEIVADSATLFGRADLVTKVQAPQHGNDIDEVSQLRPGSTIIAFLAPLIRHDLVRALAERRVDAFSMDAIPRTTRAQSMDALSSQSTISGYKAVVMAADQIGKMFPLLMTAAGTIRPVRVLIIGAGVAGLQGIGTARRMGAMVEAYDARAVVKEQVESLGAKFVEIDTGEDLAGAGGYARQASEDVIRKQQEGIADACAKADVVITTALVPGKPAPLLITADAVQRMPLGSVIVDLAGETGGNCALTKPGETITIHGVTIMSPLNLPAEVPVHASQMYAKNVQNLLALMIKDGRFVPDTKDDIVEGTWIVRQGEIVNERTRGAMGLPSLHPPEPPPAPEPAPPDVTLAPPPAPGERAAGAPETPAPVDQSPEAGRLRELSARPDIAPPSGPGEPGARHRLGEPAPDSARPGEPTQDYGFPSASGGREVPDRAPAPPAAPDREDEQTQGGGRA